MRRLIIIAVSLLSFFSCTESEELDGYLFNVQDATIYSPTLRVSVIISIDFGYSKDKRKYSYIKINSFVNKRDTLDLRKLFISNDYSYDSIYTSHKYFSILIGIFDSEGYGSFYGGWCKDSIKDEIVNIKFEGI